MPLCDIEVTKLMHKESIIDALSQRELAENQAAAWYTAAIQRCNEAREDGVLWRELEEWTGMSRQWLNTLMEGGELGTKQLQDSASLQKRSS